MTLTCLRDVPLEGVSSPLALAVTDDGGSETMARQGKFGAGACAAEAASSAAQQSSAEALGAALAGTSVPVTYNIQVCREVCEGELERQRLISLPDPEYQLDEPQAEANVRNVQGRESSRGKAK